MLNIHDFGNWLLENKPLVIFLVLFLLSFPDHHNSPDTKCVKKRLKWPMKIILKRSLNEHCNQFEKQYAKMRFLIISCFWVLKSHFKEVVQCFANARDFALSSSTRTKFIEDFYTASKSRPSKFNYNTCTIDTIMI